MLDIFYCLLLSISVISNSTVTPPGLDNLLFFILFKDFLISSVVKQKETFWAFRS